jgi:hypothetical protein
MENKKSLVIIALLSVIILVLVGYICYDKLYKKENITNNNCYSDSNLESEPKSERLTMEQMCPGCKFTREPNFDDDSKDLYHWNYSGKYQTTLTNKQVEDLYDNYEDLMLESGKSHFLGVILDNNKVVRAFSCGVINNVPFCLEGAANDDHGGNEVTRAEVFKNNTEVIKKQNLWNGTCEFENHSVRCSGELDVYIDDWGYSEVSDKSIKSKNWGGGIACRVDYDGQVYCL